VPVTVETPDGFYTAVLDPLNGMGREGRDDYDVKAALEDLPDDSRQAAALDQLRNLPVSDENILSASARMRASLDVLDDLSAASSVVGHGFLLAADRHDLTRVLLKATPQDRQRLAMTASLEMDKDPSLSGFISDMDRSLSLFNGPQEPFPPRVFDSAALAGVTDIKTISSMLHALDMSQDATYVAIADQAVSLFDNQVTSLSELESLLNMGVSADGFAELRQYGVASVDDLMIINSTVAPPRLFLALVRSGVSDFATIKSINDNGVNVLSVESLRNVGLRDPADLVGILTTDVNSLVSSLPGKDQSVRSWALKHTSSPFERLDIAIYDRFGVSDLDRMRHLVDSGVSGFDYLGYKLAGITDDVEMIAMSDSNVSGIDVSIYGKLGVLSKEEMLSLTKNGLSASVFRLFHEEGITDKDDMKVLFDADVPVRTYAAMVRKGASRQDAVTLLTSGVNIYDYTSLSALGISSTEEMIAIANSGAIALDLEILKDEHGFSINDAAKMAIAGIRFQDVPALKEKGCVTPDEMIERHTSLKSRLGRTLRSL
jgi:hypothetical protein